MTRKLIIAGCVAAFLGIAPQAASAQTKLTVGMPTTPPNVVHMPVHVARDLGFFKAENIEVKTIELQGGVKTYRAMVGGSLDIASASGPFSIVGLSKGAPTKAILANSPKLEASMVVSSKIKTLKDLKGAKVGIQQPGGYAWVLSMGVIRAAGLKAKDVKFISILSEDVPPLVAGQIDTAMLHVEQEIIAKSKRPDLHAIGRLWEIQPKNLYNVMAVTQETIKNKRAALKGYVKANIKATRALYTDKSKVLPIIIKYTGLPKDVASKTYDFMIKNCIWNPYHGLTKDRVEWTANLMEKVGNIKKGKKPTYDQIVDLSFAQEALKELGPYNGPCKDEPK